MARFVPLALASVLFTTSVHAQVAETPAPSPWQVSNIDLPEPGFEMIDELAVPSPPGGKGSRIIAGTEVMANTAIGFGIFGEKAEPQDHARSINRDYSVPKSRKAAFGVALRF
ncbi:MAG TPA: hypothetical protein VM531_01265 [Sphingomicrobium sp.]|jgi:hypothetical protein|nr:hypothetical protein [Sphingomicrobium sp.]